METLQTVTIPNKSSRLQIGVGALILGSVAIMILIIIHVTKPKCRETLTGSSSTCVKAKTKCTPARVKIGVSDSDICDLKKNIVKLHNIYRKKMWGDATPSDLKFEPDSCHNPLERRAQDFADWLAKQAPTDISDVIFSNGIIPDAGSILWKDAKVIQHEHPYTGGPDNLTRNYLCKKFIGAHTPVDTKDGDTITNSITGVKHSSCAGANSNQCIEAGSPMKYVNNDNKFSDSSSESKKYPGLGHSSNGYQKGKQYGNAVGNENRGGQAGGGGVDCGWGGTAGWPGSGCNSPPGAQRPDKCNLKLQDTYAWWCPVAKLAPDNQACSGLVPYKTEGSSQVATVSGGLHDGQLVGQATLLGKNKSSIMKGIKQIFTLWGNTLCGTTTDECKNMLATHTKDTLKPNYKAYIWAQLIYRNIKYIGIGMAIKGNVLYLVCNYDARPSVASWGANFDHVPQIVSDQNKQKSKQKTGVKAAIEAVKSN